MRQPLVIRGATIIAPPARPRPNHTVVVRGDRIAAVGPDERVHAQDAVVVDGTGNYLVPGLADMHMHFHPHNDAVNQVIAPLLLGYGITTAYCMLGAAGVIRIREAIATGRVTGPTVFSTGPLQNDPRLSAALGRRRAKDQRRRGYDAIKVYNNLSREGFDGLCAAASDLGMPVFGHIVRSVGAEETIGSKQSVIAHAEEFVYTYFDFSLRAADDSERGKLRADRLPGLATRVQAEGMTLVATLQHFSAIMSQATDVAGWMARPEMSLLPTAITKDWQSARNTYARRFSQPYHHRRLGEAAQFQLELVRAFHSAGVPVLAGTDALATGSVHGVSLHRELNLLAAAGLPAAEVLECATAKAATLTGGDRGRIENGAAADMILVPKDPTADIRNLQPVLGVVAAGRWLPAEAIWAEHAAALARCEALTGARV
jgi:cytosine/adenosine deaminase-related metal-dependent hydrolase